MAWVTVPDRKVARKIADHLLKKRLAACVSIVGNLSSSYWWQGRLERSRELLLMVKTMRSKTSALIAEVRRIHPYRVAEVLLTPIESGNPSYLRWIGESLKKR
ncbi:MAG: divalent-cation tolerance protein CutA [Elusimicrobia bacterium]|nr:divalent-cation tolerance protein CutA [Elusimicrobiota bacterium]